MLQLIHREWARTALSIFNDKWRKKYEVFANYVMPPWWAHGLILTEEIRYNYQNYLPVREYLSDLEWVFLKSFNDQTLVPSSVSNQHYKSLPDFWLILPLEFQGNITLKLGDLFSLACAIASPIKFGSKPNRYPEQHDYMLNWLTHVIDSFIIGIEYGCSTGHGTYEFAGVLKRSGKKGIVLGVTTESLEIWMAKNKHIPHLNGRENCNYLSSDLYDKHSTFFVAGDLRNFRLSRKTDIMVVNGLIGGPAFHSLIELTRIWEKIQSDMKTNGLLVVGNHFHDGYRTYQDSFCKIGERFSKLECQIGNSFFFKMK